MKTAFCSLFSLKNLLIAKQHRFNGLLRIERMVSCSAARERLRAEPRCALCIRVRGQAFNDGVFVDKVPRLKAKRRAHQIVRPARHEERESREREIGGIKPHKGINREFGARLSPFLPESGSGSSICSIGRIRGSPGAESPREASV